MKTISLWGKQHPVASWIIITCCHLILMYLASVLAFYLHEIGITFPFYSLECGLVLFLILISIYPIKNTAIPFFKASYFKRKILDATLIILSFFIILSFANQEAIPRHIALPIVHKTASNTPIKIAKKQARFVKKQLVQHFRSSAKSLQQQQRKRMTGGQFFAILGIIILGLIAFSLVLSLACNLSCSGSPALATVVTILGTALVITGIVLSIRKVMKTDLNKPFERPPLDPSDPDAYLYDN